MKYLEAREILRKRYPKYMAFPIAEVISLDYYLFLIRARIGVAYKKMN